MNLKTSPFLKSLPVYQPGRPIEEVARELGLPAGSIIKVASKVHNLTVKTRPTDAEKISLIRDIVARNVNVEKIVKSL